MSSQGKSADQAAAAAVVRHHAQLSDSLSRHAEALLSAVEQGARADVWQIRQDLLTWLHNELMPHAKAEEQALYPAAAAQPRGALLIEGMLDEHRAIAELVAELEATTSPARAAAAARSLVALFSTHLAKENDLVVPLLVDAADVSVAELLEGMHALLGEQDEQGAPAASGCGGGAGGCGCGGDAPRSGAEPAVLTIDPRLDIRDIPHDRRHATILSELDAVPAGGALVLVAPHAPRPLLAEVQARYGGEFETDWLQAGPEIWQIRFLRSPSLV